MDCEFAQFIVNIIGIARYLCGSWASCWWGFKYDKTCGHRLRSDENSL